MADVKRQYRTASVVTAERIVFNIKGNDYRLVAAVDFGVYSQMTPAGTNWNISWAEESQAKMGGPVWEYRERNIENSPLFNFDRISTPVLILHGTDDTAVPIHAGDEIFNALRRLGQEVEYAKYLGEPHVVTGRAATREPKELALAVPASIR